MYDYIWQSNVWLCVSTIACQDDRHMSVSVYNTYHAIYNIQYIYIYIHNIYVYMCIYTSTYSNSRQYVRELVNTCARQCFITLSAKRNESTGSQVIKNSAHNMSSAGALDLT